MTSILLSHPPNTRILGIINKDSFNNIPFHRAPSSSSSSSSSSDDVKTTLFCCPSSDSRIHFLATPKRRRARDSLTLYAGKLEDGGFGDDNSDDANKDDDDDGIQEAGVGPTSSDLLREKLEKIVGTDDSNFSGMDLATLIRKKYGRSCPVNQEGVYGQKPPCFERYVEVHGTEIFPVNRRGVHFEARRCREYVEVLGSGITHSKQSREIQRASTYREGCKYLHRYG